MEQENINNLKTQLKEAIRNGPVEVENFLRQDWFYNNPLSSYVVDSFILNKEFMITTILQSLINNFIQRKVADNEDLELKLSILTGNYEGVVANINEPNILQSHRWNGFSPAQFLFVSIKADNLEQILRLLIDHQLDLTFTDSNGRNLIHIFLYYRQTISPNDVKIVQILARHGISCNEPCAAGMTPLHYATEKGHCALALYFLNLEANVNALDDELLSPLHYACRKEEFNMVNLLLRHGAIISPVSINDETPYATIPPLEEENERDVTLTMLEMTKGFGISYFLKHAINNQDMGYIIDYNNGVGCTPIIRDGTAECE